MSDADTEEALAEFDFLVSVSHDGAGEARSHADTDWGNLIVCVATLQCETLKCVTDKPQSCTLSPQRVES